MDTAWAERSRPTLTVSILNLLDRPISVKGKTGFFQESFKILLEQLPGSQ